MIATDTIPLVNEFMRVVGEQVLLLHLSGQSTDLQKDQVAVCTRVLLDEWKVNPWATVSENGDKLIALYNA